jgi:hypothetical protein
MNTHKDKGVKLYRVEAICANKNCGAFLMGSSEKPHMTLEELKNRWIGMVTSAPLNCPKCPKCGYSTDRDYNAHFDLLIDDGITKMDSKHFFNL